MQWPTANSCSPTLLCSGCRAAFLSENKSEDDNKDNNNDDTDNDSCDGEPLKYAE